MKIKVNQEACIGCGACVATAGELFDFNEDGLSKAKVEVVPADKKAKADEAVNTCPTGAISLVEEEKK